MNIERGIQAGRSMVEMLGVLAVVGVLSLGALYGFRQAIDAHYANETLDGLSLRAADLIVQIGRHADGGSEPSLEEWDNNHRTRYTIRLVDEDGYPFQVERVTSGVCRKIAEALISIADVYVGVKENLTEVVRDPNVHPCDTAEEVTMKIYFDSVNNALADVCECEEGQECVDGICRDIEVDE